MKNSEIIKRNGVFFYIYIIFFGSLNILPQFFLLNYYPKNKETLLMILLFWSTLASISGVELSDRFVLFPNLSLRFFIGLLAISCGFLLSSLFLIKILWIYFFVFIVLKFVVNYFLNILDTHCVNNSNEENLQTHVNVNSAQQLLAIVFVSLILGFFYDQSVLNSIFFFLLIVVLFFISFPHLNMPRILKEHENRKVRIDSEHNYYLFLCGAVFSGFGVFTSLFVFLTNNYYSFTDPRKTAGIMLTLSCLSGAIAIIAFSKWIKSSNHKIMFLILLINFIAIVLFMTKPFTTFWFVSLLSVVTGGTYGLFMAISRQWISSVSATINNYRLLAIYNNLPNFSILFGFFLSLVVLKITHYFHINYYSTMLILISMFFPAGAIFLIKSIKLKPYGVLQ